MEQVCPNCGSLFVPSPRVKNQKYCGKKKCRRAWKREWQRQKMEKDAEYRANQRRAQAAWRERHPDYWREYRQRKASERHRGDFCRNSVGEVAKMDSIFPTPTSPENKDGKGIPPGRYILSPIIDGVAKMDSIIPVEIRSIRDD